ncbi:hypothetical protein [Fimbriiglobus ruber]|uniref:hypothetical protein n=1 Tax=Fimbriiglobus ruber TaxID=1908690 RepID=UPI001379A0AC|nr:hypothetical protein [Fimbriiglobus ruber]
MTGKGTGRDRILVNGLSVTVAAGERLAVAGRSESAQVASFRAVAGLWAKGHGRIVRPIPADILFVAQTPYMIPGTFRDQFRPSGRRPTTTRGFGPRSRWSARPTSSIRPADWT